MFPDMVRAAVRSPLLTVVAGLAVGLLISLVALEAFAELADDVPEGDTLRFDQAVLLQINATAPGWLDAPLRLITALGYYWVVIPLALASSYLFYRRNLKFSAALLLVSTIGSAVLNTALKSAFQRARPDLIETGYSASFYSFPSGHATVAVGFYGTLVMLVAWRLTGLRRWVVVLAGVALILVIGFSRLYLGVHYPTDIAAGYLAASLWVSSVGTALLFLRSLRRLRRGELVSKSKKLRSPRPEVRSAGEGRARDDGR